MDKREAGKETGETVKPLHVSKFMGGFVSPSCLRS